MANNFRSVLRLAKSSLNVLSEQVEKKGKVLKLEDVIGLRVRTKRLTIFNTIACQNTIDGLVLSPGEGGDVHQGEQVGQGQQQGQNTGGNAGKVVTRRFTPDEQKLLTEKFMRCRQGFEKRPKCAEALAKQMNRSTSAILRQLTINNRCLHFTTEQWQLAVSIKPQGHYRRVGGRYQRPSAPQGETECDTASDGTETETAASQVATQQQVPPTPVVNAVAPEFTEGDSEYGKGAEKRGEPPDSAAGPAETAPPPSHRHAAAFGVTPRIAPPDGQPVLVAVRAAATRGARTATCKPPLIAGKRDAVRGGAVLGERLDCGTLGSLRHLPAHTTGSVRQVIITSQAGAGPMPAVKQEPGVQSGALKRSGLDAGAQADPAPKRTKFDVKHRAGFGFTAQDVAAIGPGINRFQAWLQS